MDAPLDMLQVKIERAKEALPQETRKAIDAVDWMSVVLGMREKKGYSYEQIEDLGLETELLLCGLVGPEEYPKELEKRMGIGKPQTEALVNEMNELVFKKIREELIKNTERKEIFERKVDIAQSLKTEMPEVNLQEKKEGEKKEENIPIQVKTPPTPENKPPVSFTAQKLAGSFQIPTAKTDHSVNEGAIESKLNASKTDPYRMSPEV